MCSLLAGPLGLSSDADLLSHPAAFLRAGVSKTADEDGYYSYTRPEGKSGGHGIGWSEVPQ